MKYIDQAGVEQTRPPGARDTFSNGTWRAEVCGWFSSEDVLKFFSGADLERQLLLDPTRWVPSTSRADRLATLDSEGTAATQRHYFEVTFDNCIGDANVFTVVAVDYDPKKKPDGDKRDDKRGDRKRQKRRSRRGQRRGSR